MKLETHWYLAHAKDRKVPWDGTGFAAGASPTRFATANEALEWALESRRPGGSLPNVAASYQDKVRIYRHPQPVLPFYTGTIVLREGANEVSHGR